MHWNNLSDFLAMGGYGVYVWTSLLGCLGAMVIETLMIRRRMHQAMRQVSVLTGRRGGA